MVIVDWLIWPCTVSEFPLLAEKSDNINNWSIYLWRTNQLSRSSAFPMLPKDRMEKRDRLRENNTKQQHRTLSPRGCSYCYWSSDGNWRLNILISAKCCRHQLGYLDKEAMDYIYIREHKSSLFIQICLLWKEF